MSAAMTDTEFARRAAALAERAERPPAESWRPDDPAKGHPQMILGILERVDTTETSYGPAKIAILRTPEGEDWACWLLHSVLKGEFAKLPSVLPGGEDEGEFAATVRALCSELGPDLVPLEPERAVGLLYGRLTESERSQAKLDGLLTRRESQADERERLMTELAQTTEQIAAMLATAGCESLEQLPAIEEQASRAEALRHEIRDLERQIAEVGEGRLQDILAAVVDFDRAQAAVELDELRAEIERLRAEHGELKEELGQERRQLGEIEGDTAAVEAVQEVALATALLHGAVAEGTPRNGRLLPGGSG